MSILKGASAAALYGSQAANGVILITTKKGKAGIQKITFSSNLTVDHAICLPEFQNNYAMDPEAKNSWGKNQTLKDYNNADNFFQNGVTAINSVSFMNGSEKMQTYFSYANTTAKGIVEKNKMQKHNLNFRETANFFNDYLKLDANVNLMTQTIKNRPTSGGYYMNPLVGLYGFPRGEDLSEYKNNFEVFDPARNMNVQNWYTSYQTWNKIPTGLPTDINSNDKRTRAIASLQQRKITDWLNIQARGTADYTHDQYQQRMYASTAPALAGQNGRYIDLNHTETLYYGDVMAMVNKKWNDFSLNGAIGGSINSTNVNSLRLDSKTASLYYPNVFTVANIKMTQAAYIDEQMNQKRVLQSLFGTAQLGWKESLYLDVTARNDWSSTLAYTKHSSFFYPSVGLSGIISEMVKLPEFISYLKVRGSYTEVGSPVSQSGLTPGTVTTPIIGGALAPTGIYPFTDFKAERTRSYELGLSVRLWNKLSAEVTYYKSNTYNQTFIGDLPEFSGYKQIYLQAGNVQNHGWEASLGYRDSFGDFSFSSNLTFSRNVNEIKEMVENYRTDMSPEPINVPEVRKDNGRVILKVGGSINDIYANTFLKKDSQGYVEIKQDGSYGLEQGEPVFLGKTSPDFNLGWSNSLSYKGFGLSFLINGRFGGVVTSSTQAILDRFGVSKASAEARDAGGVLLPGQGRVDAQSYYQLIGTGDYTTSGYYVYSATNIRLQELTLSYRFPDLWFKNVLKDVTLSFIANNPVDAL